jgi:hypothetical protein
MYKNVRKILKLSKNKINVLKFKDCMYENEKMFMIEWKCIKMFENLSKCM